MNFSTSAFDDLATRGVKIRRACNPEGPGLRGLVTANSITRVAIPRGTRAQAAGYRSRGSNYIRSCQAEVGVVDEQPPAAAVAGDTALARGDWVSRNQPIGTGWVPGADPFTRTGLNGINRMWIACRTAQTPSSSAPPTTTGPIRWRTFSARATAGAGSTITTRSLLALTSPPSSPCSRRNAASGKRHWWSCGSLERRPGRRGRAVPHRPGRAGAGRAPGRDATAGASAAHRHSARCRATIRAGAKIPRREQRRTGSPSHRITGGSIPASAYGSRRPSTHPLGSRCSPKTLCVASWQPHPSIAARAPAFPYRGARRCHSRGCCLVMRGVGDPR
jgi:hypothetical protein